MPLGRPRGSWRLIRRRPARSCQLPAGYPGSLLCEFGGKASLASESGTRLRSLTSPQHAARSAAPRLVCLLDALTTPCHPFPPRGLRLPERRHLPLSGRPPHWHLFRDRTALWNFQSSLSRPGVVQERLRSRRASKSESARGSQHFEKKASRRNATLENIIYASRPNLCPEMS